MRLVFAGTPDVALPAFEAVLASSHQVVAVLTRPDAPAGRGRRTTASPVALRAAAAGIEVLTPQRPRDPELEHALAAIGRRAGGITLQIERDRTPVVPASFK